jgi:hypothetical protein
MGNRGKKIASILGRGFERDDRCLVKNRAKFLMDQIANEHVGQTYLQSLDQPTSTEINQGDEE